MMSRSTLRMVRTAYYVGIGLLIGNAIPMAREYGAFILDYQVTPGISLVSIVGGLVAIGAYSAYKYRKF